MGVSGGPMRRAPGITMINPNPDKQDKCVNEIIFCKNTHNMISNLLINVAGRPDALFYHLTIL
jgi:hypothetical protein